MNQRIAHILRHLAAVAAVLVLATTALAQQGQQGAQIRLDSLDALEGRAEQVVDVTLDEELLQMAASVLNKHNKGNDENVRRAQAIIKGMRGIYVRSYEFATENAYTPADVEAIRSQLAAPGWSRIANVRSRKAGDNAEVYVLKQDGTVQGLAVLAANPKELTVVNIVGQIDVEALLELEGDVGIPGVQLKRDENKSGN